MQWQFISNYCFYCDGSLILAKYTLISNFISRVHQSQPFGLILQAATGNRSIPIFQCHGKDDSVVPYELGALTNTIMGQLGFTNCSFSAYEGMDHCSCGQVNYFFVDAILQQSRRLLRCYYSVVTASEFMNN